ncbi:MAG TPA: ATP-binding protein [Actinoplanes sp.]|jgi:anti-sigma regulatory factor (Ser/Thr protein kinase)
MTSPRASVPFPAAVEVCRWTLDEFRELRTLRAALREAVVVAPSEDLDDIVDRIAVVATELATNALRHGLPPTVVRLMRQDDRLIIDVADHELDSPPEVAEDRPLGAGGLGLQLTKTFAIDVGWYVADVTKHVWASFPG